MDIYTFFTATRTANRENNEYVSAYYRETMHHLEILIQQGFELISWDKVPEKKHIIRCR